MTLWRPREQCCHLNVKCLPQVHVLNALASSSAMTLFESVKPLEWEPGWQSWVPKAAYHDDLFFCPDYFVSQS